MKKVKGMPITGARPEGSMKRPFVPDAKETSADEQTMIAELKRTIFDWPTESLLSKEAIALLSAGRGMRGRIHEKYSRAIPRNVRAAEYILWLSLHRIEMPQDLGSSNADFGSRSDCAPPGLWCFYPKSRHNCKYRAQQSTTHFGSVRKTPAAAPTLQPRQVTIRLEKLIFFVR